MIDPIFDYASFLKRKLMVGQVDPWRRTDEGKPLYVVLVPVDVALKECSEWSNQEITRSEFINYLKLNDILCLRDINEFQKIKEEKKEIVEIPLKLKKKDISLERREFLRNNMKNVRSKLSVNS
jgi:hypothetical protein